MKSTKIIRFFATLLLVAKNRIGQMIGATSVGFAYKSILCYLRARWIRFTIFLQSKPQSDGRIVLKDKREYAVRREKRYE